MSIFIKPIGGLANQLFIWATGLALKTRFSSGSLVALTHHYDSYRWHNYELDSFDSGVLTLPDEDDFHRWRRQNKGPLDRLFPPKSAQPTLVEL